MLDLFGAELLKHGRRPLYRRILLALPVLLLIGAVLIMIPRLFGVRADFPPLVGLGIQFAAGLFGFLGVILAVAVASSIGSAEYDFGTSRLMFIQEPRRWRHAITRSGAALVWFVLLVVLTAVAAVILDLALSLHGTGAYSPEAAGRALGGLGRTAVTAVPILLLALLGATLVRSLLGGIFVWLAYSVFEVFVNNLAGGRGAGGPGWLETAATIAEAIRPWLMSGLSSSLGGESATHPAIAALVVVVWIAALIGLLAIVLERRDVA